jgi:hypothetical protein
MSEAELNLEVMPVDDGRPVDARLWWPTFRRDALVGIATSVLWPHAGTLDLPAQATGRIAELIERSGWSGTTAGDGEPLGPEEEQELLELYARRALRPVRAEYEAWEMKRRPGNLSRAGEVVVGRGKLRWRAFRMAIASWRPTVTVGARGGVPEQVIVADKDWTFPFYQLTDGRPFDAAFGGVLGREIRCRFKHRVEWTGSGGRLGQSSAPAGDKVKAVGPRHFVAAGGAVIAFTLSGNAVEEVNEGGSGEVVDCGVLQMFGA